MAIGDEIKLFNRNLGATRSNVRDLRHKVETMRDVVHDVKTALKLPKKVEKQSAKFLTTIKSMRFSLKVVGKVGPLKIVAKAVNKVLDKLEDVTKKIRDKAHDLDKKIKKAGYIEKLTKVQKKLLGYEEKLYSTEQKLTSYRASTAQVISGFALVGSLVDPLESSVDKTVSPLNDVLSDANKLYDSIEQKVDGAGGFLLGFRASLFRPVSTVARDFEHINSSLDFLSSPLNATYSALKPIEGVLDAIGLVYKVTVGPVVDWVLDTLGITDIMDKVSDKIGDLLPKPTALDNLLANIEEAFGEVDEFLGGNGWNNQISDLIDQITDDLFPGVDKSAKGKMRFGTENADVLVGRNGDDVLDPRGGDDVVRGRKGRDLIYASAGFDKVYGNKGYDRLIMNGDLSEYLFSRPESNGPVVFYHRSGEYGYEVAYGIEAFVFSNGTFTWKQLRDNVKTSPGGKIVGTKADEVFYAAPGATALDASGRGGHDQFTGSEFADKLRGGNGNDKFTTQRGADMVWGGKGSDTWIYAQNSSSGNPKTTVDLVTHKTWDGNSADTLYSIENITIQDDRDTELHGNAVANTIVGNESSDWIDGRGGNDTLDGGGGRDLLIGGPGVDRVFGGEHNDTLVAGGKVTRGKGERYDGGEGFDLLFYSRDFNNYNVAPKHGNSNSIGIQEASGPLRINAAKGTIKRLSGNGKRVLATDRAYNIESFVGSDRNDVIYGGSPAPEEQLIIDGGGGRDKLYSRGANWTKGGAGNDILYAQGGGRSFDGGSGTDQLDTRKMKARWSIRLSGAIGSSIKAFEVNDLERLGSESSKDEKRETVLLSGNLKNTEIIKFGKYDDEIYLEGNERVTVYGGKGNDRLIRHTSNDGSSSARLFGGSGDDYLGLRLEGEAHGGSGADEFSINASGSGHVVKGDDGNDFFMVRRMDGTIDGGRGYDTLSLEVSSSVTEVRLDLNTGVLETPGNINSIDAMVFNFEQIIGSDTKRDRISGRNADERFLGRGGNDVLDGRGQSDELFGGSGNDTLLGGAGDDLLHGGNGSDYIDGGSGNDTVSYANAVPGGERGDVMAGSFAGVVVQLNHGPGGLGSGDNAFGNDNLYRIENVVGSSGDDKITGDNTANSLSAAGGDDSLFGLGGNDVLVLGTGGDSADGGDGRDTIVIGLGNANVTGGRGFDTLDFGNLRGNINLNMGKGRYSANFRSQSPVWRDSGKTAPRSYQGKSLTPLDILETEAIFANSADDLTRNVPAPGSSKRFEIDFKQVTSKYKGNFKSIEKVTGSTGNDKFIGGKNEDRFYGGGGKDQLIGNGGEDNLYGDDGKDTLDGGGGRDRLDGGAGADQLRGGSRADRFVIADPGKGADTIEDFSSKQKDKVELLAKVFRGLKKGKLSNANFRANASGKALDRNDYVVFNTTTGALYYDRDGSGGAKAVKLAVLKNGAKLRNRDIVLS